MEWNFGAWTLAFFAWRVDIPWQAKEHPGSGVWKYLDRIQAFNIPMLGKFARPSKTEVLSCLANYPADADADESETFSCPTNYPADLFWFISILKQDCLRLKSVAAN